MPQYMLLLYNDPNGFARLSPEERQQGMQKYMAFGQKLRQNKNYISSHKLADDAGRVMRNQNGKTVSTDGPYSETKEWLGGYYLIEAPNYDAAVQISRDCPALEHGGTIEVREVDAVVAAAIARAS